MTFMALNIGFSGQNPLAGASAPPAMSVSCSKPVNTCTATITFNTDGTVTATVNSAGSIDVNTTHNWRTPTLAGVGTNFWIRVTPTVGSLSANALSTFTQITANKSIGVTAASGVSKTTTFTVEISGNSSGSPVLSSQTLNSIGADGT